MVDIEALRSKIRAAPGPKAALRVSRDWLEQVERDLSELAALKAAAPPARDAGLQA